VKKAYYLVLLLSIIANYNIFAGEFDHSVYDRLLKENVYDGLVDYSAIKENPLQLSKYLRQLKDIDSPEYESWNKNEKMALWINAYNAITIYGVIRNYPIKTENLISTLLFPDNSIRQIPKFWKTVFYPVMGKEVTLDEIEHDILRKQFDEPRIHFALVCASIGCPKLQSFAYHPDSLDFHLDRATREFLDTKGAVSDEKKNRLYVSKIFNWYADDFSYGGFPDYLKTYDQNKRGFLRFIIDNTGEDLVKFIKDNSPEIKFSRYDWSLNELK
jgi:hypothetical protein